MRKAKSIKAFPKRGETSEEAIARVQKAHPGAKVVDPPLGKKPGNAIAMPRTQASRGSGSGLDRGGRFYPFEHLNLGGVYTIGEPNMYPLYDGRQMGTDAFVDRDFTVFPAVVIYPFGDPEWNFQTGTSPTTPEGILGTYVTNLFSDITRIVMAKRLQNISNITLSNPTPAPAFPISIVPTSLQAWLKLWSYCAITIRSMESMLVASDLNFAMSLISNALMQQLQTIEGLSRQLREFPVPRPLIDWVDRVSGVKAIDDDLPLMVYGGCSRFESVSSGPQATDLTNQASLTLILTDVANCLIKLGNASNTNLNIGTNLTTDFTNIVTMFALAYGSQAWPTKGVSNDIGEYWQGCGMAVVADATTTNPGYYEAPNAGVSGFTTVLVPRGCPDVSAKHLLSLMGVSRYGTDAAAFSTTGGPNMVGLLPSHITNHPATNTNFTVINAYTEAGVNAGVGIQNAGASLVNYKSVEDDLLLWASWAENEVINDYANDRRIFNGLDRVKMRTVDLIDATLAALQEIFLESIL